MRSLIRREALGSRFDGSTDLEFRAATAALELEESGLTYERDWWAD